MEDLVQRPKFPRPTEMDVLLLHYYRIMNKNIYPETPTQAKNILNACSHTLKCMGNGGIYDHLGGGFARYSVDELWHVPHFEKMLYDNGQLLVTLLSVYQITNDTYFKDKAKDTLNYLMRDMISDEGGFFSAEDADSYETFQKKHKKEGAFYVFKESEIDDTLTKKESIVFKYTFYIKSDGNCNMSMRSDPHHEFNGLNVLYKKHDVYETLNYIKTLQKKDNDLIDIESLSDVEKLLQSGMDKMFKYRNKHKPRPHLDDKIIAAWNGLVISGFIKAYQVLYLRDNDDGCDIYLKTALKAMNFIYNKMTKHDTGHLIRTFRHKASNIEGFAADYSNIIQACLDLYSCCFDVKWLKWGLQLQNIQIKLFYDKNNGGFFESVEGDPSILLRMKETYDGAEPSSTSIAVKNLMRLYAITNNDEYKTVAEKSFKFLYDRLTTAPIAVPPALLALDMHNYGVKQIVFVEKTKNTNQFLDDDNDAEIELQMETKTNNNNESKEEKTDDSDNDLNAFLKVLHSEYNPNNIVILINDKTQNELASINEHYGNYSCKIKKSSENSHVMAYVCQSFTCKAPTKDPKVFQTQLH